MPTYQYKCPSCEREQEAVRQVAERDIARPKCICDRKMVRIPTSAAFTIAGFNEKNGYSGNH